MDALEFAKTNVEELKARFADNNGKLSDEEVVKKFFSDQGHQFSEYDVEEVLALLDEGGEN